MLSTRSYNVEMKSKQDKKKTRKKTRNKRKKEESSRKKGKIRKSQHDQRNGQAESTSSLQSCASNGVTVCGHSLAFPSPFNCQPFE